MSRRWTITATERSPHQLNYGRQPPAWRRRRFIVAALVLVTVAAAIGLSYKRLVDRYERWGHRREIAAWYADAQAWTEPPTKLKYTENPADAANGKFDRSYGKSGSSTFTGFKVFGETPMERLPYFNNKGQLFLAGGGGTDSIMLFLHSRTTSAGLTRLIAVDRPGFNGNLLRLNVSQVGAFQGEHRIIRGGSQNIDMTGICTTGEIRIYAGQADPNDKSRFSIPFEARGRRGFIDGVFKAGSHTSSDPENARIEQEVNSTVEFTVRTEPTTQPSTQTTSR